MCAHDSPRWTSNSSSTWKKRARLTSASSTTTTLILRCLGIGTWIPSVVVIRSSRTILEETNKLVCTRKLHAVGVAFQLGHACIYTKSMCRRLNCCHISSYYQVSRCTFTHVCCFPMLNAFCMNPQILQHQCATIVWAANACPIVLTKLLFM